MVYPGCREHRTGGEEGEHTDSLSSLLDWLVTESIEHRSTKSPSPYFLALAAVFFFFNPFSSYMFFQNTHSRR